MANGADLLIRALSENGVRHVFGMPGSHSTAIYDALARDGSIATILIRNEQAGAFAADGYARVTGRPGLICTTAGPGATNALTGVAEAYADSVPMMLIAGQVNSDRIDLECGAYHEIDLDAIFRPATKWCVTARTAEEIPKLVEAAFGAMRSGRPRPTALFLPQDLLRLESNPNTVSAAEPSPAQGASSEEIDAAVELLTRAKRPIILAGGGATWGGAEAEILAISGRLHAPIITSTNGKGVVDERDPASFGHARSVRAKLALAEADAMLAVGCRFTEVLTEQQRMRVPEALVQIDVDAGQVGMNYPAAVGIVADARLALRALLERLPEGGDDGWSDLSESIRAARPKHPEWLIETLREALPEETPLFTDACEMGYRLQTDWPSYGPRRFFYPSNYITLGWGFPAALGAAVALEGKPVVAVCGDGGFLMAAQELATAARYGLRLITIVHNDSTYGAIKNLQRRNHEGRYFDVELNNPDLVALAGAFGVPGITVGDVAALRSAVAEALDRDGPSLIEVPDRWRNLRV
ncbi:thiamine pyrophosphate-binding protein [Singulisphaera sp. PoT]|uniref:thiamine pyrophosphate-binding protein n=1 Tax=Singulisphaera sp. PoT TaxID=3411797 RepID=UPI003BF4C585